MMNWKKKTKKGQTDRQHRGRMKHANQEAKRIFSQPPV